MKLVLVAPGATTRTRDAVFGDTAELLGPPVPAFRLPAAAFSAPEPACRATASAIAPGSSPVLDGLAGPDFGSWTGLSARQIMLRHPLALQEWLRDPEARPHGGESLADHLARVGRLLDEGQWPDGGATLVASTFTVRAACVHALSAGARTVLHLDVAPSTTATISHHGSTWRLQSLVPPKRA